MHVYTVVLNLLAAEAIFLFFFIFIKNVKSVKQIVDNPWEEFMRLYDIPTNHRAGVYHDLGGVIPKNVIEYYRYPNGRCPVFGKYLVVHSLPALKDVNVEGLNEEKIIFLLLKGRLPTGYNSTHREALNFPAYKLNETIPEYAGLVSPVKKKTLDECIEYAKNFKHKIQDINDKSHEIRHSFNYNSYSGQCYILFPLWQESSSDNKILYYPTKGFDYIYGSSYINSDWRKYCPVKQIKGAKFGLWNGTECIEIRGKSKSYNEYYCALTVFLDSASDGYKFYPHDYVRLMGTSSKGIGYNWANWENNDCSIFDKTPNCLLYSENAYAITSLGTLDLFMSDLPPCIEASIGWKIKAACVNSHEENYTCNANGKWVASSGEQITACTDWSNFYASFRNTQKTQ